MGSLVGIVIVMVHVLSDSCCVWLGPVTRRERSFTFISYYHSLGRRRRVWIRNIDRGFIREAAVEAATSLCMVVIVATYRGDPAVEPPCVFHAVPVPDQGDPPTHPGGIT